MREPQEELLPETDTDDIVAVLMHQHEVVKAGFAEVLGAPPLWRQASFDRLRALLAMHETAEEMVLRPLTRGVGADDVASERMREEIEATRMLSRLERMHVGDAAFLDEVEQLRSAVLAHAQAEESLEFPRILAEVDAQTRLRQGRRLLMIEKAGPTHPHNAAAGSTVLTWTLGPVASMVDHVRDALSRD